MPSPELNLLKCETTLNAVKELASDILFGGMKSADFEAKVQRMRTVREEIISLESQLAAARDRRGAIDDEVLAAEKLVVNGIVGDSNFGPDSPLYGATGRTRSSERGSGLTRKKKLAGKI
ncbi:MAG: hypothetical protein H7Z37_04075 [Pyrinomonadaceae bacterium]|nr:hypothetical protein [Pyrinomonadaceae bacterium]